jgi:UDP-N-acetylmuramoyl-tripeptide--D-alanyl-D-alanine ligase
MKWLRYLYPNAVYKQVYMLQQFEYDPYKLAKWIFTFPDLKNVINRGKLVFTAKSIILLAVGYFMFFGAMLSGIYFVFQELYILSFILIFFCFDFSWISLFIFSLFGKVLIDTKRKPLMNLAKERFNKFEGQKIAVLGSYGKTSMKELLSSVLSAKFEVAYTPGNKNVPISHARWITKDVSMDEDFLIIEYGEGEPGDISKLASLSNPDISIMTGIAPNHLDHYKNFDNLINDFLEIENYTIGQNLYVNSKAVDLIKKLNNKATLYSELEVDGWKINDIKIYVNKTEFLMKKGNNILKLSSGLIGRHNVSPLALVSSLAYKNGMNKEEIESAVAQTAPFEHRMQPRNINGAWIIDDTYNGNFEGFKAGIEFLSEVDGQRKVYVTPGLVEQGAENERVHTEIAHLLSESGFAQIVFMENENTRIMHRVLKKLGYKGDIKIEKNPLTYYQNIDQFIASGDIVLMQNDLPDAYS